LRHRRSVVVALAGDVAADRGWRYDKLRKTAVHLEAKRPILGTKVGAAFAAPTTPAARNPRTRDHPISHLEVRRTVAGRDDPSNELMTENHAGPTKDWPVVPLRRVGPADRRADYLEQKLASIGRRGLWHLLYANVARSVEDGRSHRVSTRSGL
jgi:hypothetical protein